MSSEVIEDFEKHDRRPDFVRDVAAIILVAFTLIAAVSAITRNPADPLETPAWPISALYSPDQVFYPANESITNACGYWGALLASAMFDAIGLAAALVIGAGGGIATALLMRGKLNAPVLRSFGGTIVVFAFATAANMLPFTIEGMPVVGSGGYLGAMSSYWLLDHFAPVGAWILTLTALMVGLLLTTDYALLYAGKRIFAGGANVTRKGLDRAGKVVPAGLRRKRQPFTDLESPIQIEGDDESGYEAVEQDDEELEISEPKIKFRSSKGKKALAAAAGIAAAAVGALAAKEALAGNEEEEDEEEYEEEGEEEVDDDESEEEEEAVVRELTVGDEELSVRGDSSHDEPPAPKIKLPRKRKLSEAENAKQALYANVKENAPGGIEDYQLPSIELLEASDDFNHDEQLIEVRRKARILQETFKHFNFNIRVVEIETGPVIAQYEIELEHGLRLSKIMGLADDLAIALRVPSVRIVAPDSR